MKTLATLLWLWMSAVPRVAEVSHGRVAREHVIQVSNAAPFYAPATITIRAGETVHWRNAKQSDTHSVREALHGTFSIDIPPGGDVSHQFRRAGEYHYRCRYHPWMAGRVVVEPRRLAVQWQAVPEALRNGRIVAGEGPVYLVGAGARPVIARLDRGAIAASQSIAHAIDPAVMPVVAGEALWFAGATPGTIVRYGEAVHRVAHSRITALAASGDSVWIFDGSRIGRFASGSVQWIAKVDTPLTMMRAGPDGLLWLLDGAGRLGLLDGTAIPWTQNRVARLAATAGAVWAVSAERNKLLSVDKDGGVLEFTIPPALGTPEELIVTADGVWMVSDRGTFVQLADGELVEHESSVRAVTSAAAGRDAALWLLDGGDRIGHIQPEVRTLARLP